MVIRQPLSQAPPSQARFALLRPEKPDEAVYSSSLEELLDGLISSSPPIGLQVSIEKWAHDVPPLARALRSTALVTLIGSAEGPTTVTAMARIGSQAAADAEVLRALGSVTAPVSKATVTAADNTVTAWRHIVDRYGTLTSGEVADRVGSRARNRAGAAADLLRAGRLIAVRRGANRHEFPDFQFAADGSVIPVVADVVRVLREHGWSDLSMAIWAASPSGWLADSCPADIWADPAQAESVRHAAFQDAAA